MKRPILALALPSGCAEHTSEDLPRLEAISQATADPALPFPITCIWQVSSGLCIDSETGCQYFVVLGYDRGTAQALTVRLGADGRPYGCRALPTEVADAEAEVLFLETDGGAE